MIIDLSNSSKIVLLFTMIFLQYDKKNVLQFLPIFNINTFAFGIKLA